MSEDGLSAVLDLRYANPEDALRRIASALRSDPPDPQFLSILAAALDPDKPFPAKLGVQRSRRGSPPEKPSQWPGLYALTRICVLGEKMDAALLATERRWGIARSTAAKALANARRQAERNPDHHACWLETAALLHERGHFELLWQDDPSA
jgi:Flp pilus assembly protein TadD